MKTKLSETASKFLNLFESNLVSWYAQNEEVDSNGIFTNDPEAERSALSELGAPDVDKIQFKSVSADGRDEAIATASVTPRLLSWLNDRGISVDSGDQSSQDWVLNQRELNQRVRNLSKDSIDALIRDFKEWSKSNGLSTRMYPPSEESISEYTSQNKFNPLYKMSQEEYFSMTPEQRGLDFEMKQIGSQAAKYILSRM